jgi:hypothetical protein
MSGPAAASAVPGNGMTPPVDGDWLVFGRVGGKATVSLWSGSQADPHPWVAVDVTDTLTPKEATQLGDLVSRAAAVAGQPASPGEAGADGPPWEPATLARLVASHRFTYRDERQLHDGLAELFAAHQIPVQREARLTGSDRIDFLVGRVGIEVKTHGPAIAVARQLQRYAGSDRIDALVLVTAAARHTCLPNTIGGKPLLVASLLEAGL